MRLFIAALAALIAMPAYAAWSTDQMNKHIDETNFVVNSGCSGTLIDLKNRYVLTAKHCVDKQYETVEQEVVSDDGTVTTKKVRRMIPGVVRQIAFDGAFEVRETTYRTKLIVTDNGRDLAIVQILADIPNTMVAHLACEAPVRGEAVFIVGNPMGELYANVVTGIVSSTQRNYEMIRFGETANQDKPLMQISGGVVGGNSGGAVYNADGELIGVPVLANRANEVVGFAAPWEAIRAFLDTNKRKLDTEFGKCEGQK